MIKGNGLWKKTQEAEDAAQNNDTRTTFRILKELGGGSAKKQVPIKSKDGETLKSKEEVLERWKEHFEEVPNQPNPTGPPLENDDDDNDENIEELDINCNDITEEEIEKAIRKLKNNKAPDFADDIALIENCEDGLQQATDDTRETAGRVGLKFNAKKCEVMGINTAAPPNIKIEDTAVKDIMKGVLIVRSLDLLSGGDKGESKKVDVTDDRWKSAAVLVETEWNCQLMSFWTQTLVPQLM
ncbi:Hypp6091 [Branchiostoma lanceolatum]|uniref:Hypp6091 protein n=1 Tax=Branchiostoma lanceolatum TaxID=7740 RepID=A0A8J9YNL9_BRALA|nr:Hypp6091 [Branchiostoma lanceolatum]